MYLTRMELDTTKRDTMRALTMPNLLHGAIESSFPGDRVRNLWRLDTLAGKTYLMLLSATKPELSSASRQFGMQENSPAWDTRDYTPLLEKICNGSVWQFRLVANPVRSCLDPAQPGQHNRGVVHAHVTSVQQEKWLAERAEKHGFSLEDGDFRAVHSQHYQFSKGGDRKHSVSLLSVAFEGRLTVTDAQKFKETLTEGIGRGKAYGLGLLTVVRSRV